MFKFTSIKILLLLVAVSVNSLIASPDWDDIAEADLFLMGEYKGTWVNAPESHYFGINPTLRAQVINVNEDYYHVKFIQDFNARAEPYFEVEAHVVGDEILCRDQGMNFVINLEGLKGDVIVDGKLIGVDLKRVVRVSPTMGKAAPEGAIVLLDGSNLDAWEHSDGRPAGWKLLDSGAMEIAPFPWNPETPEKSGSLQTKKSFGDIQYHMEFRYPIEAGKSGQGRGNSGVFFQGYEVQVLNSFGQLGNYREIGALYKFLPPKVNGARPPMQWQTYDIDYTAARYDGDKLVSYPRITVRLNGLLIHYDVELIQRTEHMEMNRNNPPPSAPQPISLQDHSNYNQYRNIWVKEL